LLGGERPSGSLTYRRPNSLIFSVEDAGPAMVQLIEAASNLTAGSRM